MERFHKRSGKQVQNKETTTTTAVEKGKKPMKVVYISNPKRVETSAEGFRSLVQKLTGQDSDVADLAEFPDQYHQSVNIPYVAETSRKENSESLRADTMSAYNSTVGIRGDQYHGRMGTQNWFGGFDHYDPFNAPAMMDGYGTGGFYSYDTMPHYGNPFGHHEP